MPLPRVGSMLMSSPALVGTVTFASFGVGTYWVATRSPVGRATIKDINEEREEAGGRPIIDGIWRERMAKREEFKQKPPTSSSSSSQLGGAWRYLKPFMPSVMPVPPVVRELLEDIQEEKEETGEEVNIRRLWNEAPIVERLRQQNQQEESMMAEGR